MILCCKTGMGWWKMTFLSQIRYFPISNGDIFIMDNYRPVWILSSLCNLSQICQTLILYSSLTKGKIINLVQVDCIKSKTTSYHVVTLK